MTLKPLLLNNIAVSANKVKKVSLKSLSALGAISVRKIIKATSRKTFILHLISFHSMITMYTVFSDNQCIIEHH